MAFGWLAENLENKLPGKPSRLCLALPLAIWPLSHCQIPIPMGGEGLDLSLIPTPTLLTVSRTDRKRHDRRHGILRTVEDKEHGPAVHGRHISTKVAFLAGLRHLFVCSIVFHRQEMSMNTVALGGYLPINMACLSWQPGL